MKMIDIVCSNFGLCKENVLQISTNLYLCNVSRNWINCIIETLKHNDRNGKDVIHLKNSDVRHAAMASQENLDTKVLLEVCIDDKKLNKVKCDSNLHEYCQQMNQHSKQQQNLNCLKAFPHYCNKITFQSFVNSHSISEDSAWISRPLIAMFKLEGSEKMFAIYHDEKYSVQDALLFTPSLVDVSAMNIKPMFLLYQVLQHIAALDDDENIKCDLKWSDIKIDDRCWLYLQSCPDSTIVKNDVESLETRKEQVEDSLDLDISTQKWIFGKMSNFDYLMKLNVASGRVSGNPANHPILPWISTLQTERDSWRDLTKSKYRLNKGDKQLDLQYNLTKELLISKDGSKKDIPHHIPEFLSDITYYVYKARCTSKDILCKLVRSYWEPNEYPASIQRMQEWTPEECIPEFYTDPSIFKSIHSDMFDLTIPEWADSPKDFIKKHRDMLESEDVSKYLHHWIDITFGYKLVGKDALRAKNVCLPMVDQHITLCDHGINQLFIQPHPHKLIFKTSYNRLTNEELYSITGDLDFIEQSLKFYQNVSGNVRENDVLLQFIKNNQQRSLGEYEAINLCHDHNMACFICLCFELYLSSYMRSCQSFKAIEERLVAAVNCFNNNLSKLSHSVVLLLKQLLTIIPSRFKTLLGLLKKTSNSSEEEVVGITPSLALSSFNNAINFPTYFHQLYSILHHIVNETANYRLPLFNIDTLLQGIKEILLDINICTNFMEVFMPHLLMLLKPVHLENAIFVLVNIFDIIANSLNTEKTVLWLLNPVSCLYNEAILHLSKSGNVKGIMQLFKDDFLIQLIIRFDSQTFLENFPRYLCDSLSHTTDEEFVTIASESIKWIMRKFGPTSTSKYFIPFLFRVLDHYFADGTNKDNSDEISWNIGNCFVLASELFGLQLILIQYLPHIYHRVSSSLSGKSPSYSTIESNVYVLLILIPYLSDASIMENISLLHAKVFLPTINCVAMNNTSEEACMKQENIALKFVHLLCMISFRVGREMTLQHFSDVIKKFVEVLLESITEESEEGENYREELVCNMYMHLNALMGRQLDAMLGNHIDVILKLLPHNKISSKTISKMPAINAKSVVIGNRIMVSNRSSTTVEVLPNVSRGEKTSLFSDDNIRKEFSNQDDAILTDNWLAYWGHEIGLADSDKHIHFNQIILSVFQSHTAAVRSLHVNHNEDWFASAGRDKLVKLWSLENCKSLQNENLCYSQHKKSVTYISSLNYNCQMVTADSSQVHTWDPYTGQQIRVIESTDLGASIAAVNTTQIAQPLYVVATSDTMLHLIDTRVKFPTFRYRSTSGSSVGIVRCMCVGSEWIAVGFSSGIASVLDIRVGSLISLRQCHESDIITSYSVDNSRFLTSSADQSVALWEVGSKNPLHMYKGFNETVNVIKTYHKEVITSSNSNRIIVHNMENYDKPPVETKLRSDVFKGVLTTFAVLPTKRQLLFASDNGTIKILA